MKQMLVRSRDQPHVGWNHVVGRQMNDIARNQLLDRNLVPHGPDPSADKDSQQVAAPLLPSYGPSPAASLQQGWTSVPVAQRATHVPIL